MSAPRVLIVAPHSSYRTGPFLAAAQRLGIEALVAAPGKHSIVAALAEGLHIDLEHPDRALVEILRAAATRPFAGIIGTDDATTEIAATAAAALNLPHNPPQAVRRARRKDLARAYLAAAGAPVPRHWRVDVMAPLAQQIETVGFPCVVKPVAMSGSRGVIRANNSVELLHACARAGRVISAETDADERRLLLIEEFIPGFEIAVEGMLHHGRLEILAIFDKPDPLDGPYFEETYYITPTRLSAADQMRVLDCVTVACRSYGLRGGPVHAELRINGAGVWILEVAARTVGGLCARLLRLGAGYGLEELVIANAIGRHLEFAPVRGGAGVLMIPIPQAGILRRVEGVMAAGRVRYIEEVRIEIREGYELVPLPEGSSYLGFIYARAPDAAAAEAALRAAHAKLRIVVAPLWKAVPGTV